MEGLGEEITGALEAARLTAESLGLLCSVVHEALTAESPSGSSDPTYAASAIYQAAVDEGEKLRETGSGKTVKTSAVVTFLPQSEGAEPPLIRVRDRLTLPSGLKRLVIEVASTLVDQSTGRACSRVAWLA